MSRGHAVQQPLYTAKSLHSILIDLWRRKQVALEPYCLSTAKDAKRRQATHHLAALLAQ